MTRDQRERLTAELATAHARHEAVGLVCESLTDHLAWLDRDVTHETIDLVVELTRRRRDLALVADRLKRELKS
jgi:hypothetical protein